ncbi:TPA: acyltransferase [Photobacterium damselae]
MFKKVIIFFFNYIFNQRVINFIYKIYSVFFRDKIRAAKGYYCLSLIKNRGLNCRFHGDVEIYYNDGLKLGNDVRIGYGTFIFAMGGVNIGDNCQISRYVTIYSANHDVNGTHIPYDDKYILKAVSIGHSVWVGMHAKILPGVSIGDGAIIGMGSVITKDVPNGAIVVGNPQRIVGYRSMDDFYMKLKNGKVFSKEWPRR